MRRLMIISIFLLLYTGCLCHPLGVGQTSLKNETFAKEKNEKKGTIRISGPWHSDSALDRNIDPGEDSYVKKVISSNEGINFNKDMAEAGEMFDVNGIEDFYDKNAMVTYELNGHEIPVHLKQKYTPQTKSLFPEYNRDNTATAGAMTKSPPPESYQSNTGINCLTPLQCSAATNDNSAEGKATVAQTKGEKNLLAIRNFLQLHSNQYGENHGHMSMSQKETDSNQEKTNSKEFLDNDVKLPWKTSISSAHVELNDNNKGPKPSELFSKFSNALSSNHDPLNGDAKSLTYGDSRNDLIDRFKNVISANRYTMTGEPKSTRLGERGNELTNRFSDANRDNDNHVPLNGPSENHNEVTDQNKAENQPFLSSSKMSEFTKLHTGGNSNLPPLDGIHGLENSRQDLIKQFGQDNNLLPSRDSEVANLLKKLPNQILDSRDRENSLETSKLTESSNRDTPDLLKSQSSLTNDFHHQSNGFPMQSDSDLAHGLSGLLNMKINNFIKPPTDNNGQLQPVDSTSELEKPSTSLATSTMEVTENSNNSPSDGEDPEKGKAKIRILSLLGELTDKLKGVEAVVSAQHNADHQNEENSVMSKLQSPERSDSSLNAESPAELLHHSFADSPSGSYKPLSMVSKFESLNGKDSEPTPHSGLNNDENHNTVKEQDSKDFWPSHDLLHPDLPHHDHDSLRSEPQLSTHDFPHNDLHEDTFHRPLHDNDLNSPHTFSGTTAQPSADISSEGSKISHDPMESSNSPEDTHYGSTIQGEYHGSIPEVDLKEAHKDLFSSINDGKPDENSDHHNEFSSSKPSVEFNKPNEDASSKPSAISEVEQFIEKEKEKQKQKAAMEKLKEQEKLLPDQIQKLRDQDKPFIMNTDSIDYHKEDEAEPDKSFANITPDFKPYDEDDSERGRITKYRHKISAFLQEQMQKKIDEHNPDTGRPKSEMKLETDKEFEHRHDGSIEQTFASDKKIHEGVNADEDKGFTKNKDIDGRVYDHQDKSKFSDDKEHEHKDSDVRYSHADKETEHKDSDERYSHSDRERASTNKDYGPSSRSKEPLDEKDFHKSDRENPSNVQEFTKPDRERDHSREYSNSNKDKSSSDEHYLRSDNGREKPDNHYFDHAKIDKEYNNKETDSQSYKHKDKDYAEFEKPKYHDDKDYLSSHDTKEPENKEYGKSSKDYPTSRDAKEPDNKDYGKPSKENESTDKDYYQTSKHRVDEDRDDSTSHRSQYADEKDSSHTNSEGRPLDKQNSHLDTDYSHTDKNNKERFYDNDPRDSHKIHDIEPDSRSERGGDKEKNSRMNDHEDPGKDKDNDIKVSYKDHDNYDPYKRKHENDDNEKFNTGKLDGHEPNEHAKSRSEMKDDSKSLLLESLGTYDGDGPSKSTHGDTNGDTRTVSLTPSDDYLTTGGKREHEEHSEKDKGKNEAQSEEDKMKSKLPSDASSNHQPGKDRERTLTPKSKYIDDSEYPDYNEVKDAALFETNFVRKKFHANKVSWSDRLSDKAQQLAEKVARTLNNDKIDQYKHPGENIALVRLDAPNVGKEAIDLWSKESIAYDFKSPSVTKKNSDFVQLAWKGNNEFGMGVSKSKAGNGWIVSAFYDTPYIDRFQDLRSNIQPDNPIEDPYGDIAG